MRSRVEKVDVLGWNLYYPTLLFSEGTEKYGSNGVVPGRDVQGGGAVAYLVR